MDGEDAVDPSGELVADCVEEVDVFEGEMWRTLRKYGWKLGIVMMGCLL